MSFWSCNIDRRGRIFRAVGGVLLLAGAAAAWWGMKSPWLAGALAVGGAFALFEAARRWCVLRAFKIKTPW